MIIKVGPVTYTVNWMHRPRFQGKFVPGVIDYFKQRIETYVGLPPTIEWINLWHETIHAILKNAGVQDHDEDLINALAHGICLVLKDNPQMHQPIDPTERDQPEDDEPKEDISNEFNDN